MTVTGVKLNLAKPRIQDIKIGDIGHSLSMLCRFNGHCPRFYSVAQHSVIVSYIIEEEFALEGLAHDFTEFAVGDTVTMIKKWLPDFKAIENNFHKYVIKAFNLNNSKKCREAVKKADRIALLTEARDLLGANIEDFLADFPKDLQPHKMKIKPLSPTRAYNLFMDRFFELTGLTDIS